jgi:hypothetical protein
MLCCKEEDGIVAEIIICVVQYAFKSVSEEILSATSNEALQIMGLLEVLSKFAHEFIKPFLYEY